MKGTWGEGSEMLRLYARIAGATIAFFAIAGWFGVWDAHYGAILICCFTAVVFLYVTSRRWRGAEIRAVVGGVGVLHLLAGGFIVAALFMVGSSWEDLLSMGSFVYVGVGILSVLGASFLPCEDGDPRERS